jgi:hypothetical protein
MLHNIATSWGVLRMLELFSRYSLRCVWSPLLGCQIQSELTHRRALESEHRT